MKAHTVLITLAFAFAGCSEKAMNNDDEAHSISANDQISLRAVSSGDETPAELAKQCCNCWSEVKTAVNPTGQARKADACSALTMQKLAELQEMGVTNDWNRQQVETARSAFDAEYKKCE